MTPVAVVAHRKKTLGGGLVELRELLTREGCQDLLWYEVPKSRKAPKKARRALREGAGLVFVWGGDGMVQRCVDALAGTDVPIAILPAGTANLLARNLEIPADLRRAVHIGLHGARRRLDLGRLNDEHFAVMAGAGLDGKMIRDADRTLKDRAGPMAYVWTSLRHVGDRPTRIRVTVDGRPWFDGNATCVLLGNVGMITGGIRAFDDARPDDGRLEIGVATATGALQWARTVARMAVGRSEDSPFVELTRGRKVRVRCDAPVRYELDGGARGTARRLRARVVPGAITVCVPEPADREAPTG